jgi:hypothetical protein
MTTQTNDKKPEAPGEKSEPAAWEGEPFTLSREGFGDA